METIGEIVLHEVKQVAPDSEAFARLKFPEAVLLLPGDRFILRQFSPVVTIGGGVMLDAAPIPRMPGIEGFLRILAGGEPEATLGARIARRGHDGISMAQLVTETGGTPSFVEAQLATALQQGRLLRIGDRFVHSAAFSALQRLIVSTVERFHQKNSLVGGIAKEELREQVKAAAEVFAEALVGLVRERKIETGGDLVRLPGHGVVMKDEEAESKRTIESAFANAGLKVPALAEVIARAQGR